MSASAIEHIPVLAEVLVEQVCLPQDAAMVDTTVGSGGHSILFGRQLGPEGVIIGLDVDQNAIRRAQAVLGGLDCRVILRQSNFSQVGEVVRAETYEAVDFVLADLGVSSEQLGDVETGLSFQQNMSLDMRMDKSLKTTAADIVNKADEKSLADLIYRFGEDRASRRIARFIVQHRKDEAIRTTGQLAAVVSRALGRSGKRGGGRIHPATRTFQALRIAVNDELANLERLLATVPGLLKRGGIVAVISYHSLEDRLVKNSFRDGKQQGIYEVLTKNPIQPSREEVAANRRARSAKLRIAKRV